jgi:hypothetical protein
MHAGSYSAAVAPAYKHFKVSTEEGGIAIITYDRTDNKVNALNTEVGTEMMYGAHFSDRFMLLSLWLGFTMCVIQ